MFRVISANLNGIRSAAGKGFYPWLEQQDADVVCLQELKAQAPDLSLEMLNPPGFHGHFHYAEKKGYSGVGIYSKKQPGTGDDYTMDHSAIVYLMDKQMRFVNALNLANPDAAAREIERWM